MSKSMENLRTRVGKYELGRVLGEGAFAKVRFAKNIETGKTFAIKILDKEKVIKNKLSDQIRREISTMKLIKHPNVVQLYEIMASKRKIYFVLEYVPGGELFYRIKDSKGGLKEDEARKYFQQLINAVDFCHSRGVFHRDLKPENLLLDGHFNLKVSDFGLSALPEHFREDGLLHTTCGTPHYVAPEVIIHKGYDGAKADLWSCGIILFVLLAGFLPFDDSDLMNLYRKINRRELRYPRSFPSGARRLLTKILNPAPTKRIAIKEVLEDSWFKKGYAPPKFVEDNLTNLHDVDAAFGDRNLFQDELVRKTTSKPVILNAFEIISLSKGLNLSGLFERPQEIKQELHFTSKYPASEIILRMEETAKPLGFNVQKRDYKMEFQGGEKGRKGTLSVSTEVFELAPSLFVVEVKKGRGDSLEYQNFYQNFSKGLKDIVWKNEVDLGR